MAKQQPRTEYTRLQFPGAGVVKRLAHEQQSPYSTPAALNVRPDDVIAGEGRERGGSRCGVEKAYATQLGGGAAVNLVTEVRYVSGSNLISLLMAASNGSLYPESGGNFGSAVGSGLATGFLLSAANLLQKLYVAGAAACKVYDPVAPSFGDLTASAGTAPTNCRLVCAWLDRLVLAGDTGNPHIWYMSATGDATDWDYTIADDAGAAVAATSAPQAMHLPSPITALIAHSDECLIFGCIDAFVILRGDPLRGGTLSVLSSSIGVLGPGAWCYTPDGYLFFMSSDGLYVMPPGCGSAPTRVSRERLPEELLGINLGTHEVTMAYDIRFAGIHLFVSHRSSGTSTHYWIDTTTMTGGPSGGSAIASFWPMSYQSAHRPLSLYSRNLYVPASADKSSVLMGCADGFVRRQSADLSTDDGGSAISAFLDYGPFPLAPPGYEGLLDTIDVTMGAGSGTSNVAVRVGQTAQQAFAATNFESQNVTQGLNPKFRPRARGASGIVRISSTNKFAVEEILVSRKPVGPRRVL